MSGPGPVVPVFTWVTVENEARTDGSMTTDARRKLVIDVDGWNWLRAQVPDRVATLLLELAILSERDPGTGARYVSASQEQLGRLIGRGQRGWGRAVIREMVAALVSLGLLREVAHRPLGTGGGSVPKVLVLDGALFTVAASLSNPYNSPPARLAEHLPVAPDRACEPLVANLPVAPGPVPDRLAEAATVAEPASGSTGIPAGQVSGSSADSRVSGPSHGSSGMDECSSIQDPPAGQDVAATLVVILDRLGFGDAARVVDANAADLAWVTAWVQHVMSSPRIPNKGGYLRKLIDPAHRGAAPRSDPPGWIPGTTVILGPAGLELRSPEPDAAPRVLGDTTDLDRDMAVLAHFHDASDADLRIWRLNARLRAAMLAPITATGTTVQAYYDTHLAATEASA